MERPDLALHLLHGVLRRTQQQHAFPGCVAHVGAVLAGGERWDVLGPVEGRDPQVRPEAQATEALGVQVAAQASGLVPNLLGEIRRRLGELAAAGGEAGQVGAGTLHWEAELGLVGALAALDEDGGRRSRSSRNAPTRESPQRSLADA